MRVILGIICLLAALLGVGCRGAGSSRATSDAAKSVVDYATPSSWACLPDRNDDPCQRDLSATEIRADGGSLPASSASTLLPIDCFYVYPTVDLELVPGNHTDFRDPRIANVVHVQAARFREVCSVYVPFYRQVTIGTYLRPRDVLEEGLALAFRDVEAAFHEYLARFDRRGRPIVLVGHSQGAGMINRLLRRFFDGSSEANRQRRSRLVVAMPIGNDMNVGAFSDLPLCTSDDETGCVLGYRTHLAGSSIRPPKVSIPNACVNPAGSSPGKHLLSRAYFPVNERTRGHLRGIDAKGVTTPFIMLRDYYTAECTDRNAPAGYHYLAITPNNDDPRVDPIDYARDFPERGILASLGLHILDMQFAQGDLIDTIARRGKKKLGYASSATAP